MAFGDFFGGAFGGLLGGQQPRGGHITTDNTPPFELSLHSHSRQHTWPKFPEIETQSKYDELMQLIAGAESDEQALSDLRKFALDYMAQKMAARLRREALVSEESFAMKGVQMAQLPDSPQGLVSGSFYSDNGTMKIVK